MDLRTLIEALVLGAIEGLTEFIPVSSTGHLILFAHLFGFDGPPGRVFEIVIQLGAILAVCFVYRRRLAGTALGVLRDRDPRAWRFSINVLLAFLPSVVVGVLAHGFIKAVLFSPYVVCVSLIVGGVLILLIEKRFTGDTVATVDEFDWKLSLKIGLCQVVAMIPGVSRSGATIMGARMLGVNRAAATEFSFFLAIPTMLAATVYDAYSNFSALTADSWLLIAAGFAMAFVSAVLVVSKLVDFVSRNGFGVFAWYRIGLGSLMLALLLL